MSLPRNVFIPSMDARFGYVNDIPENKRPDLVVYNDHKKHYQLQSIVPTSSYKFQSSTLKHSLVVGISLHEAQLRHGPAQYSWKLDFGSGSPYNKSGQLRPEDLDHRHAALLTAVAQSLKKFREVNRDGGRATHLYIQTNSESLFRILGWGEKPKDVFKTGDYVHGLTAFYGEVQKAIKKAEAHGRHVKFWLIK